MTALATAAAFPATEVRSRPLIEFDGVTLSYGRKGGSTLALAETSFSIAKGEFLALVGPSGCGKSTLLKLVAGLIRASTGTLILAGREIGAEEVRIGVAFQNPTLLPWMNVRQNVMLPLKISRPFRQDWRAKRKGEYRDRADALLTQVGLIDFANRFPWQLSGGMQQRASLCRALIHEPTLLLLDEPFGALDAFTREELWATMQDLWIARRPTVILVTHDLRESAFLADRIIVMSARPGRIMQDEAVPFARPRTAERTFEADFVSLTQRLRALIVAARTEVQVS